MIWGAGVGVNTHTFSVFTRTNVERGIFSIFHVGNTPTMFDFLSYFHPRLIQIGYVK